MRPASIRSSSSPFVKRKAKAGAKKLGIDWDKVELSDNHKADAQYVVEALSFLRDELRQAERDGRESKAKKIRREISKLQETQLAIQASWCGGCLNYLHNCRCSA